MAYCEEKALPHSVFLGRAVAPDEPLWLPEDRAKVLAYRMEKALRCTKCNTAQWEWDADQYAYEPIATSCPGCQRMNVKRDEVKDNRSAEVTLVKPDVAERMRRAPRRRPRGRRKR